jgi:HTH-type transcriptional regulator, sugar sensing transcriptional regulator
MGDKGQLLNELTDLGLTQYEAKAYLALVSRDRYTAAELARESGIPRQRIYDVLGSLAERGLVRVRPGQVVRYSAIDPQAAVGRLLAVHRSTFDRLEQATSRLVSALTPLWSSGRAETDPLDYVEVIRDRHVLAQRFADIEASAKRQMLTLSKLPYLVVDNPEGLRSTRRLVRAGGDVRCIYEYDMLGEPAYVANTRAFVAAGERARLAAQVPMRLCIVDGVQVLMSLRDPVAGGTSSTNILIEHPALAQCLISAFETMWSGAEELTEAMLARSETTQQPPGGEPAEGGGDSGDRAERATGELVGGH